MSCVMICAALMNTNMSFASYVLSDTGPKTPAGEDKESDERPNNVPICPVPTSKDNIYVTLGGGGIFVVKANNGKALIL